MTRKPILALYSIAHFWVDLSCAFLAFRFLSGSPDFLLCLLLYNFCAFALQMPLGIWADGLNRNGLLVAVGCGLTAAAFLVPLALPAAVVAGVGNALFHLGGGIDVLNAGERKAAALGVFVSPGAVGLYVGTLWGGGEQVSALVPLAGLLLLGGAILWLCRRSFGSFRSGNVPVDTEPLRGSMGLLVPLVLVLALAAGKAAGGFLMDAMGPRRAAAWSLGLGAALYLFSGYAVPGLLAVFLFNMTMPMTLWAAAKLLPGAKGFAFGLLTFALFVGYLPVYLGWPGVFSQPWACAGAAALSLALLWRPMGKEALRC